MNEKEMKTINDPVHGHITLTPLQEKLMETPELQRLAWVRQLGLTKLVFPGANNTRLEHSLGVSFIAGKIAEHLDVSEKEKNLVQAAGLLHDIGHAPFSHTLEALLKFNHMVFTGELITGKKQMPFQNTGRIPEILKEFGVSPKDAAALVNKKYSGKKYLQQIVFGEIDADQMDFLGRDAYYTGTTYGMIDIERTIKTMTLIDNEIMFYEKGISSIESFLIARDHMYSAVYIHHTASIAEKMMIRAAETALKTMPDFYSYTDDMLLTKLRDANPYAKEMIDRIIYRNLFKRAFVVSSMGVKHETIGRLRKLADDGEHKIEEKLCLKTGVKQGYVLVDMPVERLKKEEPRLKQANINLLRKDGTTAPVYQLSGVTRALMKKEGSYELFSVFSRKEDVAKVKKAAEKLLK